MADTELATALTGTSSIKSLDGNARAWVERILPLLGVGHTPNTPTIGLASPNILQAATQSVSATSTGQPGFPKVMTIDGLVKAIEAGDEPVVKQGVATFAKVLLLDQRASNGETPLTQAAKATSSAVFRASGEAPFKTSGKARLFENRKARTATREEMVIPTTSKKSAEA